jgi:dTDP-4-dehydrorhamnose reductase
MKTNGYIEEDFDASKFNEIDLDWPNINYVDGKRSAEAFLVKNYYNHLLCILRLPIILGKNDPTSRTQYFVDAAKKNILVNLSSISSGKANFVSKIDVVTAIFAIIRNFKSGTYNVAVDLFLNQYELLLLFIKSINQKVEKKSSIEVPFSESPFYYKDDFMLNTQKFAENYNLKFGALGLIQELKIN